MVSRAGTWVRISYIHDYFDSLFLLFDFRSGMCRRNVTGSREKL